MIVGALTAAGGNQVDPGQVARSMQSVEDVPRRGQVIGLSSVGWLQVSSDLVVCQALLIRHREPLGELDRPIP